jgi:hypothetical protein
MRSLRPQDSAARLGGDEFAVLVEGILNAGDLETVAKRILAEMARPFDIFGHHVQAGASIGAAMAGPDHTSSDLLVRDADFAMYRAKQSGGGRYEIFDKHLEVVVTSQQERERELRYRLDKRLLEFLYQPILRLHDGRLEGFECLLRWRRPDGSVDSFMATCWPWPRRRAFRSRWAGRRWRPRAGSCGSWRSAMPQVEHFRWRESDAPPVLQPDLVLQLQRTLLGQRRRPVAAVV